jgi:hypothetical protein
VGEPEEQLDYVVATVVESVSAASCGAGATGSESSVKGIYSKMTAAVEREPTSERFTRVFDKTSLSTALANSAKILLAADITLTATIVISGLKGVVINGNGFKVDGNNSVRCFSIQSGA